MPYRCWRSGPVGGWKSMVKSVYVHLLAGGSSGGPKTNPNGILTLVMTVCPPMSLTKSVTWPGGAFSIELPPVDRDRDRQRGVVSTGQAWDEETRPPGNAQVQRYQPIARSSHEHVHCHGVRMPWEPQLCKPPGARARITMSVDSPIKCWTLEKSGAAAGASD